MGAPCSGQVMHPVVRMELRQPLFPGRAAASSFSVPGGDTALDVILQVAGRVPIWKTEDFKALEVARRASTPLPLLSLLRQGDGGQASPQDLHHLPQDVARPTAAVPASPCEGGACRQWAAPNRHWKRQVLRYYAEVKSFVNARRGVSLAEGEAPARGALTTSRGMVG